MYVCDILCGNLKETLWNSTQNISLCTSKDMVLCNVEILEDLYL